MSFDIGKALRDGIDRATKRNAALAFGLVFALQFANAVVNDSFTERLLISVFEYDEFLQDLQAETSQTIEDPLAGEFPLAFLNLPVEVLGALTVAAFVAGLVVRMGIIRAFTSTETETLPAAHFTDRLGMTVLNLIAGAILYALVVGIGLVLLIVPGIYLAVALFFYNYEIIVERKNVFDALAGSWELTAGKRFPLFLLGLTVLVLDIVVGTFVGLAVPASTISGSVLGNVLSAAITVFSLAVAAQAYNQLRGKAQGPPDLDEEPMI